MPDMQIRPGANLDHLDWISNYAIEKRPDTIVLLGDWADMPSLSSYDVGKKCFEGRTYRDDILSANDALQRFMAPIEREAIKTYVTHSKRWNPRKVITLGNHEDRIDRAIETDRKLDGLISTNDLFFTQFGFEVYPFLKPVMVDGIAYCHYFTSGVMGRPVTTARALLVKKHMSCIAGHQQGYDVATDHRADGRRITAIICGSGYPHNETYLNDQTNKHWRGIIVLNEVEDGSFDEMKVSLRFLQEKYS